MADRCAGTHPAADRIPPGRASTCGEAWDAQENHIDTVKNFNVSIYIETRRTPA
ncbi:hypothetical protein [Polymorphospora rubra]|uniref:hypothetical protein n=1 Tax=Polymorphospora rubra TaxID=338584 RepID=UPI001BB3F45C|nr:hypothetical protein [Polymorphospora rubra]